MKNTDNQKYLIKSGALWSVYYGLTGAFLVAYALALGASNSVIGLLAAVPYLAIMLAEFPGAKLVEFYSRMRICVFMSVMSKLIWIPIILIPVLFKNHPVLTLVVYFFIIMFTEYVPDPAWMSLVGDIVPAKVRGTFFAKRNMMLGVAGAVAGIVGAAYLDLFPKESPVGFSTMFAVGILFGLWSAYAFSKIKTPPYRDHKHHSFREFFKLKGDFKKFVFIMVFFNFAVMLASPFFVVYMLKSLDMSYTLLMVAAALVTGTKILAHTQYGKITDKYGDKPVAIISMLGTALVPLCFLFITKANYWFVFPVQIISGIVWAGVDLSVFNLILDLSDSKTRALSAAKYSMFAAFPMIIAPIIGGYIADNVTIVLVGIPLVFAMAFILRMAAGLMMFSIKEPRAKTEHPVGEVLMKLVSIHPVQEIEHAIKSLKKSIKNHKS